MKKLRERRIISAVCCLFYMGWMIKVSTVEFGRINGQYRRIIDQLGPDRLRTAAREELIKECRRASPMRNDPEETACSSWPPGMVTVASRPGSDQANCLLSMVSPEFTYYGLNRQNVKPDPLVME